MGTPPSRRRHRPWPVGIRSLCLSLVMLGLIDTIALSPLAVAAAAFPGNSPAVRAGFAVLGIGGVAAAVVVLALPRLSARTRLARFRLVRRVKPRATPGDSPARGSLERPATPRPAAPHASGI
jgi:hypothetical protein